MCTPSPSEAEPRKAEADSLTTNATTAMDTVFNTCELSQLILFHLDIVDLIAATSVCQQWRELIFRSRHMQLRLLQDALPTTTTTSSSSQNDITINWNEETGSYWVMRLAPTGNEPQPFGPADLLIYRTPGTHIELLLPHSSHAPVFVDSKRSKVCQRSVDNYDLKEAQWYDDSGSLCWSSLLEQTTYRKDGSALTVHCGDDGTFHFGERVVERRNGDWEGGSHESCSGTAVMLAYLRTYHNL